MSNIKLYNTGTIYKLYGIDINNNEVIYIGSTINALCNRKAIHKYHAKKYKSGEFKNYCSSFDIYYNCKDIKIEALEIIKDCALQQLRDKEDEYIKKYDCINKNYAKASRDRMLETCRRSAKAYYYRNLEQERAKKKEYYHNNKQKVLDRVKENHKKNYDKIKEYQNEYRKEYVKRPEVIQRMKEYREVNKEKLRIYAKERYYKVTKPMKEKFIKKNNID